MESFISVTTKFVPARNPQKYVTLVSKDPNMSEVEHIMDSSVLRAASPIVSSSLQNVNLAQQKPIFVLYADSIAVSNFISLISLTNPVPGDMDANRLLAVGRLMATFAVIPSVRDMYRRHAEAAFSKWTELTIVTWVQVALLAQSAGILNTVLLRGGFLFKSANTVERWLACLKEAEDESEFEPRTAKVLFWMTGAAKLGANLGSYRARFVGELDWNGPPKLTAQTTSSASPPRPKRTSGSSEPSPCLIGLWQLTYRKDELTPRSQSRSLISASRVCSSLELDKAKSRTTSILRQRQSNSFRSAEFTDGRAIGGSQFDSGLADARIPPARLRGPCPLQRWSLKPSRWGSGDGAMMRCGWTCYVDRGKADGTTWAVFESVLADASTSNPSPSTFVKQTVAVTSPTATLSPVKVLNLLPAPKAVWS
ncbi:hypothetical protein A1Q2_00445 [Trichosporon asahii var. asahii CBS 8904]|uniref:Uncharacterized protein n=1 Tax=Trichosporon asahii var. asahii (strain CBS 8904) TaxID=1220162 RepID=K1VM57_TRIAC|nr:hypothetical protein A1Q2_00445 [Trichosporon asahii var. asahii CBS 8904]